MIKSFVIIFKDGEDLSSSLFYDTIITHEKVLLLRPPLASSMYGFCPNTH